MIEKIYRAYGTYTNTFLFFTGLLPLRGSKLRIIAYCLSAEFCGLPVAWICSAVIIKPNYQLLITNFLLPDHFHHYPHFMINAFYERIVIGADIYIRFYAAAVFGNMIVLYQAEQGQPYFYFCVG